MNKKVLIINLQNHNYAGGIEKYCFNIIPILHDLNYDIYEYSTCENIQTKVSEPIPYVKQIDVKHKNRFQELNLNQFNNNIFNFIYKSIEELKALRYQRKHIKEIAKNFDLIICNQNFIGIITDKDHPNILWVQHFDFYFLKRLAIFSRTFVQLISNTVCPYKQIKQKVVYSKNSQNLYKKFFKKNYKKSKFYSIFLSFSKDKIYQATNIEEKNNKPVVFLGRIHDVSSKKVGIANKVAKYLDRPINVYGEYKPCFVKKYKYLNFQGKYNSKQDLNKIFENSSLTLITSKYEGVSYVGIESIMHSTPLFIRNTYAEAKNLLKNNNGLLIDKKMKPKQIAKVIKNTLNDHHRYEEMVKSSLLYEKELSYETFVNAWKSLIQNITKSNF